MTPPLKEKTKAWRLKTKAWPPKQKHDRHLGFSRNKATMKMVAIHFPCEWLCIWPDFFSFLSFTDIIILCLQIKKIKSGVNFSRKGFQSKWNSMSAGLLVHMYSLFSDTLRVCKKLHNLEKSVLNLGLFQNFNVWLNGCFFPTGYVSTQLGCTSTLSVLYQLY